MTEPIRAGIVGFRGIGQRHAQLLHDHPDYTLVAGCDLVQERVDAFAAQFPGTVVYTDYAKMLPEVEMVIIATNNVTHAPLTIQAAEAGVHVYAEKPMAHNLADAQAMVAACQRNDVCLAVNHQRRLLPVFVKMRQLIADGTLGEVYLIRASCAGDVLSDGTHLVDTTRHLAGDAEVSWVFGQIMRERPDPDEPQASGYHRSGGYRYGHPVESGALALLEFETGLRAEIHTGAMQVKGRRYQDYEVFGTEGRLHRAGDSADPPLLICDQAGWRPVEIEAAHATDSIHTSLTHFAAMIRQGTPYPLQGTSALKVQEVVMAIYESARLRARIDLPLHQPRFPLEILVEDGVL